MISCLEQLVPYTTLPSFVRSTVLTVGISSSVPSSLTMACFYHNFVVCDLPLRRKVSVCGDLVLQTERPYEGLQSSLSRFYEGIGFRDTV